MKVPGVVVVLCVVPSRLVLHIGLTSCTFPLGQECPRKMAMAKFRHFSHHKPVYKLKNGLKQFLEFFVLCGSSVRLFLLYCILA